MRYKHYYNFLEFVRDYGYTCLVTYDNYFIGYDKIQHKYSKVFFTIQGQEFNMDVTKDIKVYSNITEMCEDLSYD